jgi:hypothetical protein
VKGKNVLENNGFRDARSIAPEQVIPHHSGKLGLAPVAPSDVLPRRRFLITMTADDTRADLVRKALRRRVERMIDAYVRLEFSMRSAAGRMVVDETRLLKKRRVDVDLDTASETEVLDAIYRASIRRAVFAPPSAPVYTNRDGTPMRRVVPARDVANIIRSRSSHGASGCGDDVRNWRGTVAQKLSQLTREQQSAVLEVAKLRLELRLVSNQLAAARSSVGRLKRGGRDARALRARAEARVLELRTREVAIADRKKTVARSGAHRTAIDRLVVICTKTPEIEAYCFRETER